MPTGADWDHGSPLNMKEARRLTTGTYAAKSSTSTTTPRPVRDTGLRLVQHEAACRLLLHQSVDGVPQRRTHKVELTGHLDDNDGGDPTLLDYWRGTHYGGSVLPLAEGEDWTKVVGPILRLREFRMEPTPTPCISDAFAQAAKEAAKWPYGWVQGVDYPQKTARDRDRPAGLERSSSQEREFPNLLVGLLSRRQRIATWQNDAKHYQFWVRGTPTAVSRFPTSGLEPTNCTQSPTECSASTPRPASR